MEPPIAPDPFSFYSIAGWIGSVIGAIFVTWSLAKNKGYEAQKEAAQSWRANYDAKAEELAIANVREKELQKKYEGAMERINKLEADVIKLEARPDMSIIIQSITSAITSLNAEDVKRTDAVRNELKDFHAAQIKLLETIARELRKS